MSKSEVKPREWTLFNGHTGESRDFISGDAIAYAENVKVIELKVYQSLQKENEELKAEIAKLKEYKWMYEDLCK